MRSLVLGVSENHLGMLNYLWLLRVLFLNWANSEFLLEDRAILNKLADFVRRANNLRRSPALFLYRF
jgi:hypothetical protein